MKRLLFAIVLLIGGVYLIGCSSTTSDNVKTSGIYAIFTIENKYGETTVTARATLQVGGITGSYVELVGDDELYCDDVKLSTTKPGLGIIEYKAQLPKKNAQEKYVFKFKRKDEEHTIDVIQLKDLHITEPTQSQGFKISDDIKIKWEPASTEEIDLSVNGDCIDPFTKIFSTDNGEYIISGGTLKIKESAETTKCTATILLKRYISTGVPKEFDGGNAFSYSKSEVNIQIEK